MDSQHSNIMFYFLLMMPLLVLSISPSSSSNDQDKAECSDQLFSLATCLPYVGGDEKEPELDCCTGIKQVMDKSKKCLCVLIKDRNDPQLGLKINATLAVTLPSACHAPSPHISQCISLLHLAPNSKEAKEFESLAKISDTPAAKPPSKGDITSRSTTTSASEKSDGERLMEIKMFYVVLLSMLFFISFN